MSPEPRAERWLFYAHNRLADPALAEVFEAAKERGGIEPWFAADERAPEGPWSDTFSGRRISVEEAAAREWDVVLAADNQKGERVPAGYRVRLPHGAAFGLHGYGVLSLGRCDLFVATSEGHLRFLERHRHLCGSTAPILVGGHPRLDRLWRQRRERGDVIRDLGLDPSRPTVAIASHWVPQGNLRRFGAALPRAVLEALPGANVLQAGHPNLWQRVRYDIGDPRATLVSRAFRRLQRELFPFDYDALFRELGELASTVPRFRLLEPDRTFDALAAADVLVSDWSSVTVEFTLFDRPIVLYRAPDLAAWDEGVDAAYLGASHPFRELAELGPALREALSAPGARAAGRAALRDLCLDGRSGSAARIVDLVLTRTAGRGPDEAPEAPATRSRTA